MSAINSALLALGTLVITSNKAIPMWIVLCVVVLGLLGNAFGWVLKRAAREAQEGLVLGCNRLIAPFIRTEPACYEQIVHFLRCNRVPPVIGRWTGTNVWSHDAISCIFGIAWILFGIYGVVSSVEREAARDPALAEIRVTLGGATAEFTLRLPTPERPRASTPTMTSTGMHASGSRGNSNPIEALQATPPASPAPTDQSPVNIPEPPSKAVTTPSTPTAEAQDDPES